MTRLFVIFFVGYVCGGVFYRSSGEESELSFFEDIDFFIDYFRASNPAVKFVILGNLLTQGYSSNGYRQQKVLAAFKELEKQLL